MAPAIENPAGDLVPDLRSPVFTTPEWVRLPEFLAPHLAARNSVAMTDLEYDLTGALHFSNGGGVYTATDKRTGEQVILKEARPHAGLAADGSDAVTRLHREHDVLLRLSGLGIAPEVRGFFQVGEHYFLAEEFIPGRTLNSFFVERYPLRPAVCLTRRTTKAYTAWALRICGEVERAAAAMHERGVVFNDLHMFNIIVRPDDTVAFIDFEAASDISEGRVRTVGNPGFAAPRDRAGFDVDAYSLACLRLAMFMPLTTLFALDRDKAAQLAVVIAGLFPVPEKFLDEAVREITRGTVRPAAARHRPPRRQARLARPPTPTTAGGRARWDRLAADMVGAIRASATPDRTDRLFPGDIDQFRVPGGGLGLAHGAAGVLYALTEAAGVRVPEYEEWLVSAGRRAAQGHAPRPLRRAGRGGVHAGTARPSGRRGTGGAQLPRRELGPARPRPLRRPVGVRARHDLRGRPRRRASGWPTPRYGPRRSSRHRMRPPGGAVGQGTRGRTGGAVGLLRGASGKALLFIRLYERTGDPAYLDAAEACHSRRPGTMRHRRQWRAAGRRRLADAAVPRPRQRRHRHGDRPVHGAPSERGVRGRGARDQARRQLRLLRAGRPVQRPRGDDRLPGGHPRRARAGARPGASPAPMSTGWRGTPSGTRAAWRSPGTCCCACQWTWAPAPPASCWVRPPRSPRAARRCRSSPGPQASLFGFPGHPRRPCGEPPNQPALARR